ncbi:glycosyltransferase [Aquirhabdus sp.]|uniref:glycosyltransferase n=1 Tax=Aquirhabdus sp. TaxID=2824160 RepID=UPI00396D0254
MRIVIDLQGVQSNDTKQAIGRYCLSLTQAILRNKGEHEVILALNGLFPETIEPIRAAFDSLLPQEQIRIWHTPDISDPIDTKKSKFKRAAELIREAFIANLKPDVILITSLFEGLYDSAVTTIGLFNHTTPTAVSLYDRTLFTSKTSNLERSILDHEMIESWYENKLDQLRRAHLLLSTSELARNESIEYLGLPASQSVNIGNATDARFQKTQIPRTLQTSVLEHYSISKPFILYVGGLEPNKNVQATIRAFALLPEEVRKNNQLIIVCEAKSKARHGLETLVKQFGLCSENIVVTGFIPNEDLITLYNLCQALIAPSAVESFNMSVLEAMSCGAAVIGANTTSLAETIGRTDALFDPLDDQDIADKISKVLSDKVYQANLAKHTLEQSKSFSWDQCAKRTLVALEELHETDLDLKKKASALPPRIRPKLAYVSPLPPLRSGISDYSAELLPELSRFYDIDVIVEQDVILSSWVADSSSIKNAEWLARNAESYDRVIYHFGNSEFHQYMFDLIEQVPGIVVLHDFFISGIVGHMELQGFRPRGWAKELYHSHGYNAVKIYSKSQEDAVWKYPCNKSVLESAQGVIVHSNSPKKLGTQWLGEDFVKNWSVIPLLRAPAQPIDRTEARQALDIPEDAFVICSFGLLGPTKQNKRLLDAWLDSKLSKHKNCHLIFVGEAPSNSSYTKDLLETIADSDASNRIKITGWASTLQFRQYLAAADLGVQLRTQSRGETSAAVLDCMNYGLACIANANGSMAELPQDAVWMLDDDFENTQLTKALETLWKDHDQRNLISTLARQNIRLNHTPRACAEQYARAIEDHYEQSLTNNDNLIKTLVTHGGISNDPRVWLQLAQEICQNHSPTEPKQLFLDISALVETDLKTGIQRVIRSILLELLTNPPAGYKIEPVYARPNQQGYHYARQFSLQFLECPRDSLVDAPVEVFAGDIFLIIDLHFQVATQQSKFFNYLKQIGVPRYTLVYDLLPILQPNFFPSGTSDQFKSWLEAITQGDGAICISRAVADELVEWLDNFGQKRMRPFKIGWFHLGADVAGSTPSKGLPANAQRTLNALSLRPTFLIVGTIEPRKGHAQTMAAFAQLWDQNEDVNLVIVGKRGWVSPEFIYALETHKERGHRFFWLEGISDEYLEKIYAASTCLIAPSFAEGFGLPLIEAAQHELPLIVRDIPVFAEVAGNHAFYFSGETPRSLATAIQEWLQLDLIGKAPQSDVMPWLTWKQSTQGLLNVVLSNQWSQNWIPSNVHRFRGNSSLLRTKVGKRSSDSISSTGTAGWLIYGPYVQIPEGQYNVAIRGTIGKSGLSGAWADVSFDHAKTVLKKVNLNTPDAKGNFITFSILIDQICDDLEVRIWVNNDTEINVSMIEITPLTSNPSQLTLINAPKMVVVEPIANSL